MFKMRLKVGFSVIYLFVQLKKLSFIFKDVLFRNNKSWDDKIRNSNDKLGPE